MGLVTIFGIIEEAGGKIALEELHTKSPFNRNSTNKALLNLKKRRDILIYRDTDGKKMVRAILEGDVEKTFSSVILGESAVKRGAPGVLRVPTKRWHVKNLGGKWEILPPKRKRK